MHTLRTAVVFLLLAAGTAAAQDSATQDSATITGSEVGTHKILRGFNEKVTLQSIDHKLIGTNLLLNLNVTRTLTPGRHTIRVLYTQGRWLSRGNLWLDAEPGKAYIVHAYSERRGVSYRIEEVATGRVVGGVDPGDDLKDELPPPPASQPASSSMPSATTSTAPNP